MKRKPKNPVSSLISKLEKNSTVSRVSKDTAQTLPNTDSKNSKNPASPSASLQSVPSADSEACVDSVNTAGNAKLKNFASSARTVFALTDDSTCTPSLRKHGNSKAVSRTCQIEQGVFQELETRSPTATFLPLHYEPNYAYPLIVWLHTPGETEQQLLRIMPLLSLRNYAAAAVRGCLSFGKDGMPKKGFYWDAGAYEITFSAVLDAIQTMCQKHKIASNRIYLAGCEEGGTMAQRLVFRNPHCFSGAISFDGAVPEEMTLLEHFKELKKVRFLYAVSRGSRTCPPEPLCANLRLLYAAGVPVTLRNYPTMGSLQADMLRDANRWIMGNIESALL